MNEMFRFFNSTFLYQNLAKSVFKRKMFFWLLHDLLHDSMASLFLLISIYCSWMFVSLCHKWKDVNHYRYFANAEMCYENCFIENKHKYHQSPPKAVKVVVPVHFFSTNKTWYIRWANSFFEWLGYFYCTFLQKKYN